MRWSIQGRRKKLAQQHRVVITVLTLQTRPRICRLDPRLHRLLTQTAHPGLRTLRSYRAMIGWGFMLVYNRKTIRGFNAMPFSTDLTLRNFSCCNIFTGQKKQIEFDVRLFIPRTRFLPIICERVTTTFALLQMRCLCALLHHAHASCQTFVGKQCQHMSVT